MSEKWSSFFGFVQHESIIKRAGDGETSILAHEPHKLDQPWCNVERYV